MQLELSYLKHKNGKIIHSNLEIDVQKALGCVPGFYLVEVNEIFTPAMKVKGVKIKGRRRLL